MTAIGPEAGWYDDGHGKQRWWDGSRWTEQFIDLAESNVELHDRASEQPDSLAGVVLDGRRIAFGAMIEPVGSASATIETGRELLGRGALAGSATARTLIGPSGPITPRLLRRAVDPRVTYLCVSVSGQVWLAPIGANEEARARAFASLVTAASQRYRFD